MSEYIFVIDPHISIDCHISGLIAIYLAQVLEACSWSHRETFQNHLRQAKTSRQNKTILLNGAPSSSYVQNDLSRVWFE